MLTASSSFRTALLLLAMLALASWAEAPAKTGRPAPDAAPNAAAGNATVTFKLPPGFVIAGGTFLDSDSMSTAASSYKLSPAVSPTIPMRPPRDAPEHYNLGILQVELGGGPGCNGAEEKVVACLAKQQCGGLPKECKPRGNWKVTTEGACGRGIKPDAGNRIELSLTCGTTRLRSCECKVSAGTSTKVRAETFCPFTCQQYNSASKSCVGAPTNAC